MNVYTLRFSDDGDGVAKRIEFKAEDLTTALIIAHREASRRTAELWEGARKLCTVRRSVSESEANIRSQRFQIA